MRPVASAFYNNPVLFLGALQIGVSSAAAAHVISGWITVGTLAIISLAQRQLVKPIRRRRSRRA